MESRAVRPGDVFFLIDYAAARQNCRDCWFVATLTLITVGKRLNLPTGLTMHKWLKEMRAWMEARGTLESFR